MNASPLNSRLKSFLSWAILFLTASYTFLDYWAYSKIEHADPASWQRLATGQGIAPAQYRIGVYFTANFVVHLFENAGHLHFRHIFAASDFICTGASLAVLFFLLTRSFGFRERDLKTQWALVFFALLLTQFYLAWTLWFQEPETMPSLAILAASALLCSGALRVPRLMLAVSLLLVAVLGATIRVDAVIALHAGLLLAVLATPTLPLGRAWQIATSSLALASAFGIERFLAHAVFPHAVREAALIQLGSNLHSLNGWIILVLALPAWALTVWLASRHWRKLHGWAHALVLGSLIHFAMFLTFGMSEEVRIFVPFALTLLPLSTTWLCDWFESATITLPS